VRILVAHCEYRQRGGEDVVFETETALLREGGHDVSSLSIPSGVFSDLPLARQMSLGLHVAGHSFGRNLLRDAIQASSPDVVHFHNLYPLLGPSAIIEAASLGCATVQTLHNYRLSCIAGTHFRNNSICEECHVLRHGPGVRRGCYRGSRTQSFAIARGLSMQGQLAVKRQTPDVLICLTEFMRNRLVRASIPADMLAVKPNSVADSLERKGYAGRTGVVFVGRLSPEKGIAELLQGWSPDDPHLRVVGAGPLESAIKERAVRLPNVTVVGPATPEKVRREIGAAKVLLLPSRWYEGGLPLVALEALAEGTPVVGFALGASLMLNEVDPNLLVTAGDFSGMKMAARCLSEADDGTWTTMSEKCRRVYSDRYTPSRSLGGLESAYAAAIQRASKRS